jgi:hypothetical protein
MVYHLNLMGLVYYFWWTLNNLRRSILQLMNNHSQSINLSMVYHLNLMGLMYHLGWMLNNLRGSITKFVNDFISLVYETG